VDDAQHALIVGHAQGHGLFHAALSRRIHSDLSFYKAQKGSTATGWAFFYL
jgi:hypothetical protein